MPISHILQLSLNCFPVHQPATKNSMHLQFTWTSYFQHLSYQVHIWNPAKHLRWSLFAEIVNIFRPLAIFVKELHCGCLIGL